MRLEFRIELSEIDTPRFAVEAVEGIGKLFTLATLVLNVLENRKATEIVFHGLNPEDPGRKIAAFRSIMESAGRSVGTPNGVTLDFTEGERGSVPGSSSYYQWLGVKGGS